MTLHELLTILLAAFLVLATIWCFSGSHDFSASVNPMIVDADPGNITHTNVDVTPGFFYSKDVTLQLGPVPPGIHIEFKPKLIKYGNKSASNIIISIDKNVTPGEYTIPIVNEGSDGKKHGCNFTINVSGSIPPPTSTTTPKLTPTPSSISSSPSTTNPTTTSTLNSNDNSYTNSPISNSPIYTNSSVSNSPIYINPTSYNNSPSYSDSNINSYNNSPFSNSQFSNSSISSPININSNNKP